MSVINTNLNALVAQESSRASGLKLSQAMERLSTGTRINSAKDDATGLAISNRMTSQIRGMAKATQNVNDAISMTQTAEGALGNISDVLQRMRELAVQSSTGTNNDSDRASIQLEVSQLQQQIQDMATKTNHNNIKLLDGSAQNVTIQSGVKAGDTVSLGFASMQTKDIGLGSRASLTSIGGNIDVSGSAATKFGALSASALYLNGVAVGASVAVDDNASPTADAAASAIAKVAAINKVSNLSGVYAKVDTNNVSGSAMTAAAGTGTVTINGVTTDSFSTTTDASLSRKNVVAAINAKSALTGVVATDTNDDNLGVTLSAADGRNIVVSMATVTAASTGLTTTTTANVGSFDLFTLDGRNISVSTKTGSDQTLANTGLRAGTYKSDVAQATSYLRSAATAAAPSSATQGLLNSNSMIINGVAIGQANATDDTASDTTATSSTRASSAIAIAAAINRSSAQTGVTATAAPNVLSGTGFTAGTSSTGTVFLNGQYISINTQTRNGVIDSLNSYSSKTGVVASAFGDGIQLTAADGRNISIASSAGAAALGLTGVTIGADGLSATGGAGATTYTSQVTLSSANKFTVAAGTNGVTNLENLGFRQGTFGGSDNGLKINQVDVSTSAGASQAITAIDAAINTVSAAQAKSGALNNRLDTIISNLAESSQNMSASKSRIMDTDYATETTNLAKQQIISQAATAMLAQANQQSQSVLSLLK